MSRYVSFHALAREELREAATFYALESPGLRAAFLDEIERAVQHLLEYPKSGPLRHGSVRAKLLHRFPYTLLYRLREKRFASSR